MTSTPRLDATLCFVDEDRATLGAEDEENEEGIMHALFVLFSQTSL
jgi:hypothetical protein